jgi:heptosyltransferase-3
MAFFTGARWRIGRLPKGRDRKFAFFYTHFLDSPKKTMHEVDRSLEFLKPLGIRAEWEKLYLDLPASAPEALAGLSGPDSSSKRPRRIGIHLTSRPEEGKYWDDQNYIDLAHRLTDLPRTDLYFSYGPDQDRIARRIIPHLPPEVKPLMTQNLKTFGAYAKALELLVTIEGGPMHLAAAAGTPLLALFGKTDPRVWSPWGVPFRALRRGREINRITVEEVFQEAKNLLEGIPVEATAN